MKVLLQRVMRASVSIDQRVVAAIEHGVVLYVGFGHTDTLASAEKMAHRCAKARVFSDAEGKLNLSVVQVNGEVLSISQFTLLADTASGHRPSFTPAMPPEKAQALYDHFNTVLGSLVPVKTGKFGEHMVIDQVNDGPVSLLYESEVHHESSVGW
jgi:D-tyrosyl-tRNA(Tyr) deacylase